MRISGAAFAVVGIVFAAVAEPAVEVGEPVVICRGPTWEEAGWGPYQFPRAFVLDDGRIAVSVHVSKDAITNYADPYRWFVTSDGGVTWQETDASIADRCGVKTAEGDIVSFPLENSQEVKGYSFTGFEKRLPDGRWRAPATGTTFPVPDGVRGDMFGGIVYAYLAERLPEPFRSATWLVKRLKPGAAATTEERATLDWPFLTRVVHAQPGFKNPVLKAICPKGDAKIGPDGAIWVSGFSGEGHVDPATQLYSPYYSAELFRSTDGGRTFSRWSHMEYPADGKTYPYGSGGFSDNDFAFMPDGSMVWFFRSNWYGTTGEEQSPMYVARSTDMGRTWSRPERFADLGTFPRVIRLANGATAVMYGRPGLFVRVCEDESGLRWSKPVELLTAGDRSHLANRPQANPSFHDWDGECGNGAFVPVSADAALAIYGDFYFPDADGVKRKTILCRRVRIGIPQGTRPEVIDNDDLLSPPPPDVIDIRVDPTAVLGPVKPMNAGNNAPSIVGTNEKFCNWNSGDAFADLEVPMSRTHDSRYAIHPPGRLNDLALVFPDFEADENDPKNYDFELTDIYLNSLRLQGTKIMYCLGSSNDGLKNYGTDAPPRDPAKWARIAEHIIRHYNEGWGWTNESVAYSNQFDIAYWELWNEPDLDCSRDYWTTGERSWEKRHRYWNGSPEQFFAFYATAAKQLKRRFPSLKFGGPALAGRRMWAERFLEHCRTNAVPIDFFSWHKYSVDAQAFADSACDYRRLLDRFGYTGTESILNEWNYNKGFGCEELRANLLWRSDANNYRVAAFFASVMSRLQHEPVDMLMLYDMRSGDNLFNGLFAPVTSLPQKGYFAFYAWARLRKMGREVAVRLGDTDDGRLTAVAARNDSGAVTLLVTRYTPDANIWSGINLRLSVHGRQMKDARLHLMDEFDRYTERSLHLDAEGALRFSLAPNAFAVIELP